MEPTSILEVRDPNLCQLVCRLFTIDFIDSDEPQFTLSKGIKKNDLPTRESSFSKHSQDDVSATLPWASGNIRHWLLRYRFDRSRNSRPVPA
jgi:hypothetical protein